MLRNLCLAGVAIALLQVCAAPMAPASSVQDPPIRSGSLLVSFTTPQVYGFIETFRFDLLRLATGLPITDLSVYGRPSKIISSAIVTFSVRGGAEGVSERLARSIETLPYVAIAAPYNAGAGEPDIGSGAKTLGGGPVAAAELRLESVRPNPTAGRSWLVCSIPEPGGDVRVQVYDSSGRLVAEPFAGWCPAGIWTTFWNATGSGGRATAPGVYLVRIQAGRQSDVRRVVVSR